MTKYFVRETERDYVSEDPRETGEETHGPYNSSQEAQQELKKLTEARRGQGWQDSLFVNVLIQGDLEVKFEVIEK